MTAFLMIFRRFLTILQNLPKGLTNVAEHFPKISKDCQRLSRNTQTKTNLISVNQWNNQYLHQWGYRIYATGLSDEVFVSNLRIVYLTSRSLSCVLYSDKTRQAFENTREIATRVFYISRVFSNVRGVLSQCNTRLRILYLLYDIDFTRAKRLKHVFSMFYTLIRHRCLTNQSAHRVLYVL